MQRLLRDADCRLLVLDEVQDILQGSEREQLRALEGIKLLMNELSIHILAFGTDRAGQGFRSDPHLAARFTEFAMPSWKPDASLANFLVTYERLLPLRRPSNLGSPDKVSALAKAKDPQLRLRRIACEVATLAAGELWGVGPHGRDVNWLAIEPESYELVEVPSEPQVWLRSMHALRRVVDLNWRRTFLWLVAMSLGGTEEFGALLSPAGDYQPWRRWWNDCLIPAVGETYRGRFEGAMDRLSNRLDGKGRHGLGGPSLAEKFRHRPALHLVTKSIR